MSSHDDYFRHGTTVGQAGDEYPQPPPTMSPITPLLAHGLEGGNNGKSSPTHSPPRPSVYTNNEGSSSIFTGATPPAQTRTTVNTSTALFSSGGGSPTPLQLRSYRSIREDLNRSSTVATDAAAAARLSAQQAMGAEMARQKELQETITDLKGQLLDKSRIIEHLEGVVIRKKDNIIAQLQGELSETNAVLRLKDGDKALDVQMRNLAERDARLQQDLRAREETIEALENQLRNQELAHRRNQKTLADDVSQHVGIEGTLSLEVDKLRRKLSELTLAEEAEQDRASRQLKQWREKFTVQSPIASSSIQSQLLAGNNATDPSLTQTPVPSNQYSPANARETLSLYLQRQCEVLMAGAARLGERVEELQSKTTTQTSLRTAAEAEQSRLRVLLDTNAQNKRLSDSRQGKYFTEEDALHFSQEEISTPTQVTVTPDTSLSNLSCDLQRAYDEITKLKALCKNLKIDKDDLRAQLRSAEEESLTQRGGEKDDEKGMLKRSYDRVRNELVDLQNRIESVQQDRDRIAQDLNLEKRRSTRIQSEKDRKEEELLTYVQKSTAMNRSSVTGVSHHHDSSNVALNASGRHQQQHGSPNRSSATNNNNSQTNTSTINEEEQRTMFTTAVAGSPRTNTLEKQAEELEHLQNALQQSHYEIKQLRKQLDNEREGYDDSIDNNSSGGGVRGVGKVASAIDGILKDKISALEQSQAEAQRLGALLSGAQDALELERTERRVESIDRVTRIEYLEDQVSQLSSGMNDSILQIQTLRTSLNNAEANLENTTSKEKKLTSELDVLREEMDQVRIENTFYKTEVMQKEMPSLKQHVESLTSLTKRLEGNLKETKANSDNADQLVMQLKIKLDRCEHDKEGAREVASLAEDHVNKLTVEATDLSTQLGKLEVVLQEEKAINRKFFAEITSLSEETIPRQQQQVVELEGKLREATTSSEKLLNTRQQLETQLEALTVRYDKSEGDLRRQEELVKLSNNRVGVLEKTVAAQAETCEKVHTLQGENDGLRKVNQSKDEMIERMEGNLAEKRAVEEELWEIKFRQTPQLQSKLKDLQERSVKLERDSVLLQSEKDHAEKEQTKLMGQLQASERDREVAEGEVIALKEELEGGGMMRVVGREQQSTSNHNGGGGLRSRLAEAEASLRHKASLQGELDGLRQVVEELREERTITLENLKKSDSERSWLQSHLYGVGGNNYPTTPAAVSSSSLHIGDASSRSPNRSYTAISNSSNIMQSNTSGVDVVALVPTLQKQVKELKVHASARQEMMNALQDELDTKAEKMRHYVRQINDLRSNKADSDARVQCLSEELADVTAQLDNANAALRKLKDDTDAERKRREELLKTAREERRQAVGDFMERGDDLEEEKRRRSRAEAASESFQAAFAASEFKVGSISTDLAQLQQQYNKLLDKFESKNADGITVAASAHHQHLSRSILTSPSTTTPVAAGSRSGSIHHHHGVNSIGINSSRNQETEPRRTSVLFTNDYSPSQPQSHNSSSIHHGSVFVSPQRGGGSTW